MRISYRSDASTSCGPYLLSRGCTNPVVSPLVDGCRKPAHSGIVLILQVYSPKYADSVHEVAGSFSGRNEEVRGRRNGSRRSERDSMQTASQSETGGSGMVVVSDSECQLMI